MSFSYDPTNALVRSSFASLMKSFPEIRKVFYDNFKKAPTLYDKYLVVANSTKNVERENTVGPRGIWTAKTEANEFTFGNLAQGTEIAYTNITYADAFDISEELMEDNQFSYVMKNAAEMGRGGYAAVEDISADVLNNAFTSGTGADDTYLCNSAHNLINSANTGDNALTDVLSADGLKSAYALADATVSEADVVIPTNFSCLVVPPALRQTAEELMDSEKNPENANNAVNTYKNRITEIQVNPYLSSTTAWFLIDKTSDNRGKFYWRVKPQFINDRDVTSGNFLMKARQRFVAGFTNWQGVIGSTGAGS